MIVMRWGVLAVLCAACSTTSSSSTTATTGTMSSDPRLQHNLNTLNTYRAQAGVAALLFSDALNQFAAIGSEQLAAGAGAHGHFQQASSDGSIWKSGFCGGAGENQAPGWPINGGDEDATIDAILKAMMDEGPGGGHYDNIVDPDYRLIGVGLKVQNGLYFTNDFSKACP